jgi:hypothetical protein
MVQSVTASGNTIQVVIKNQGNAPVVDDFWVDVYINPNSAPTHVNQLWQHLASQGLVWGRLVSEHPLQPGATLTLNYGDQYYWQSLSRVNLPLGAGTVVYAQVDSWNGQTTYGAVLESDESAGGPPYNNIRSMTISSSGGVSLQHTGKGPELPGHLPPRQ